MQPLVVDSSVIVKWLNKINENNINEADKILEDTEKGKVELFAPELAKYEIGNVLLRGKQLTPREALISFSTVYALPITFVPESIRTAVDTFNLASKFGITYYDAAFLSLAKEYNATLVTENVKHQGKTNKIRVIALENYSVEV